MFIIIFSEDKETHKTSPTMPDEIDSDSDPETCCGTCCTLHLFLYFQFT